MKHLRIFDTSDPVQEAKMEELLDNAEYKMVISNGNAVYVKNNTQIYYDPEVNVYYSVWNSETQDYDSFSIAASLDEPIQDILDRITEISGKDLYSHHGYIKELKEVTDEISGEKEWEKVHTYNPVYTADFGDNSKIMTIRSYGTYQGGKLVAAYYVA